MDAGGPDPPGTIKVCRRFQSRRQPGSSLSRSVDLKPGLGSARRASGPVCLSFCGRLLAGLAAP
jgi:hypothetical protein